MIVSLKPRSIFGATVAGFLLVMVPLLIVAAMAAVYAKQIAVQSSRLLDSGIRVVQQCRVLEDVLVAMERATRQYQVVPDDALLQRIRERHADVQASLRELGAEKLGVDPARLERIRVEAAAVAAEVPAAVLDDAAFTGVLERFERMREAAADIGNQARLFIEGEAEHLQGTAVRYQRLLILCGVLLAPLMLVVALLLAVDVAMPLRRLDRAIRALGAGRLEQQIPPAGGPVELQRLSRQLDWLRERLRTVEEDKSRFLRAMAHELKTPLASVREGADLLSEGALGRLSTQQQEVADILRNNSFELQHLIENLLAYEEWRSHAGRVELSSFPLRTAVEHCVQRFRLIGANRGVALEMGCDDEIIQVDRTLLRMALDNLVGNAVKFSPPGGTVTVSARVQPVEDDTRSRRLVLEVADEGPGIPHGERTRIYEAFYQGAPPPGQHIQGTGVGLSVVQDFVSAHRGRIEIVDGEFPGAHFRIELPQPAAEVSHERARELAA